MLVVSSDRHRGHAPLAEIESSGLQPPFEHPGRADAIDAALRADERFRIVEPDPWGIAPIEAVHDPGLVAFLERAWREYQVGHPGTHDVVPDVFALPGLLDGIGGPPGRLPIDAELGRWCFETTTPLTSGTFDAARGAVDVALTAARAVLDGAPAAYGLCRPPGHHAPRGLYGGYCFFNNAAIAAHHVASTTGVKVSVLDVDYHHGNGTQQIFYGRDDVQYVSLHGDPVRAYPDLTGHADERGSGRGRGANLNLPLPMGADDDTVLDALARACEAVVEFGSELVVVSLGVDTHERDPISDLAVTTEGFARQGAAIAALDLPVVIVQEGGYDIDTIGVNVVAFVSQHPW
ncbi:MAG TPA: histone deacetylase family protein [Ilumatobacteraceae bacterium]|nr:histone deacetylase family protein [Ilumatobacteraceae bacterium]